MALSGLIHSPVCLLDVNMMRYGATITYYYTLKKKIAYLKVP